MTIPLLFSQKHDSFLHKHGAALGAARSGLSFLIEEDAGEHKAAEAASVIRNFRAGESLAEHEAAVAASVNTDRKVGKV